MQNEIIAWHQHLTDLAASLRPTSFSRAFATLHLNDQVRVTDLVRRGIISAHFALLSARQHYLAVNKLNR